IAMVREALSRSIVTASRPTRYPSATTRTTYSPKARSLKVSGVRPLQRPFTVTAARDGVDRTTSRPAVGPGTAAADAGAGAPDGSEGTSGAGAGGTGSGGGSTACSL